MTMAGTSPVSSVWSRTSLRLCSLLLRRPLVILSCQLIVTLSLIVLSLQRPLVILSRQLVVALPLTILLLRRPLVLYLR
jgi:hypothetical protein